MLFGVSGVSYMGMRQIPCALRLKCAVAFSGISVFISVAVHGTSSSRLPFVLILSSVCIICFFFVRRFESYGCFFRLYGTSYQAWNKQQCGRHVGFKSAFFLSRSSLFSRKSSHQFESGDHSALRHPLSTRPQSSVFSSLGGYVTSYFGGFTKSLIEFFGGGIRGIGHNVVGHNVIRFCCY